MEVQWYGPGARVVREGAAWPLHAESTLKESLRNSKSGAE